MLLIGILPNNFLHLLLKVITVVNINDKKFPYLIAVAVEQNKNDLKVHLGLEDCLYSP